AKVGDCKNYYATNNTAFSEVGLSTDRKIFADVFNILRFNRFYGKSSIDVALGIVNENISQYQIIFCLEVFLELGIFTFNQGSLQFVPGVKSDLATSKIYKAVKETQI
ncbi:MAG: hypothetical protein IJA15_06650, partial [Clostridia bacterium]|nr:hypothetical protein [Clostridia bacterium]